MAQFDSIIKGGAIADGARVPRYRADIDVKSGKIAEIGRLNNNDATQVLDASRRHEASGFIDLPTYYDA